jgi:hypothetical protein
MIPRSLAAATVTLFSIATLGCNSQPVSPSGLTGTPDLSDATPRAAAAAPTTIQTAAGGRAATTGMVYVTSQGLYFDTFVARDPLPMKGQFQLLEPGGITEFGPGDPGYRGGRWWEDLNGNGVQDEGDHFFLCPLLPPGRPTP